MYFMSTLYFSLYTSQSNPDISETHLYKCPSGLGSSILLCLKSIFLKRVFPWTSLGLLM